MLRNFLPRTALVLACAVSASLAAAEASGWRGNGTGCWDAAGVPSGDRPDVAWRSPMPGPTSSGPALIGDMVVTLADPLVVICVDAKSGTEVWRRSVDPFDALPGEAGASVRTAFETAWKSSSKDDWRAAKGRKVGPWRLRRPGDWGATIATPTGDGASVWVVFDIGFLVRLDLADGRLRWSVPLTMPKYGGSSPLLTDGAIVVMGGAQAVGGSGARDKKAGCGLHAYDAETGRLRWVAPLAGGMASGSPVLVHLDGEAFVVSGLGSVHRLADGAVVAGPLAPGEHCTATSPVVAGDQLFLSICGGHNHEPRYVAAYRLAREGETVTASELWRTETLATGGLQSPVVHGGMLFKPLAAKGFLVVDVATGERLPCDLKLKLSAGGHDFVPSPAVASGRLYQLGLDGTLHVIATDRAKAGSLIGNGFSFEEPVHGDPVFADGCMIVRTQKELVCLGAYGGRGGSQDKQ